MDLAVFKNKKICVATSGGADSTALLHYLKFQQAKHGYTLSAVHCEHGIRGEESKADMRFVQELCTKWDVPLYLFQENCLQKAEREKLSLETAAREFRRTCFLSLIRENKADYIATAHHVSDEAETVLFRIARGSALAGAGGMKETDGVFIRPFLTWTKAKILSYAQENGLSFCTDATNFTPCATRNKLRLQVMPILNETVAGAEENIARFAFLAVQDDSFLQRESEKLVSRKDKEITVAFSSEPSLFRRACLTALKELGVEKDYTFAHLESLFALQNLERSAKLTMPQGVQAEKTVDGIAFYRADENGVLTKLADCEKPFDENGFDGGMYVVNVQKVPFAEEEKEWKILRIDKDKLPKNAVFRFRRDGDCIEKFGGGTKTLKKLFNEKKIRVDERAYLPLIAQESGNKVFVVCGVEIADEVKITDETKQILYIRLEKQV